jgi:hypothetical protein
MLVLREFIPAINNPKWAVKERNRSCLTNLILLRLVSYKRELSKEGCPAVPYPTVTIFWLF